MKIVILICFVLIGCCVVSAQTDPSCPKITVTGQAGITVPGDSTAFKASVNDAVMPLSAKFAWTVSAGTIESGQGTSSITVRIPNDLYGYQIKAIVKITEPFSGCKESLTAEAVAESAPFVCGLAPDDYPKLNRNEERARLLNAAYLWSRDSQDMLVFVIHVATSETAENAKRRAAFIRDFF